MPAFTQSRSYIIRLVFIVAFLIMLVQLFNLQVLTSKYEKLAQDNAIFKKPCTRREVLFTTGKAAPLSTTC